MNASCVKRYLARRFSVNRLPTSSFFKVIKNILSCKLCCSESWLELVISEMFSTVMLMLQGLCAWSLMHACFSERIQRCFKNRPLSFTEAFAIFSCTFLSLTCQEEKHITRCCCSCGYELSMWQGCVQVCLSVPCSFEECPQSTRSSGIPSKLVSKYHLNWEVIPRGHG